MQKRTNYPTGFNKVYLILSYLKLQHSTAQHSTSTLQHDRETLQHSSV
uniref:Uncharacterized protein n=1 Tax=Anguilla anguilla TaxID=7936 RepID=A0A0E9X9L1_ANGAN